MKNQDQNADMLKISSAKERHFQEAHRKLIAAIQAHPFLVQGSVNAVPSSSGKERFTWTRKIRAKTKTISLSEPQAAAFQKAIETNRAVEDALRHIHELSQDVLLDGLPSVSKRRKGGSSGDHEKAS